MPDLKLQHASITESEGHRHVEMVFADQPDLEEAEQHLTLRLEIDAEGYPRLPAAQLVALRNVRNLIGDEIRRLEQIRGQAHASEDW